jgi:hypothetical protein
MHRLSKDRGFWFMWTHLMLLLMRSEPRTAHSLHTLVIPCWKLNLARILPHSPPVSGAIPSTEK